MICCDLVLIWIIESAVSIANPASNPALLSSSLQIRINFPRYGFSSSPLYWWTLWRECCDTHHFFATKMIFRYSLQAHKFYRNLRMHHIWRRWPHPNFPKERSRNWIYFMFQISLDYFICVYRIIFPKTYSMSMTNVTPDRSEILFLNLPDLEKDCNE
jgi:hypothetical protein